MSELTFAEAMELDPSEVEIGIGDGPAWYPMEPNKMVRLSESRNIKFRRAKPKRRRVDEMAVRNWGGAHVDSSEALAARAMTSAIFAVCEWLRLRSSDERMPGCDYAQEIEREFLEPR